MTKYTFSDSNHSQWQRNEPWVCILVKLDNFCQFTQNVKIGKLADLLKGNGGEVKIFGAYVF